MRHFLTLVFSFVLITNSAIAGSTNVDDFYNKIKQAYKLYNEGRTKEALNAWHSTEKNFDIENLKVSNLDKSSLYYQICSAIKKNPSEHDILKEKIYYCSKSFEYIDKDPEEIKEKLKATGSRVELKSILINLHIVLTESYYWFYDFYGGEENLELAEKHALKYLNIKKKKDDGKIFAILSFIYFKKQNIEKSIHYRKKAIDSNECNSNEIPLNYTKKIKEQVCYRYKTDLGILKYKHGEMEEAKKIWHGIINNETDNILPMNKSNVRMHLFRYYNKKGNRDEAEKYLYEALNLLNPENPSHKRIYFSSLYMFYSFLSEKGYPYDAIKGYLKLLNDVEKEFPKSGLIGEILFLLSRTYNKIGEHNEALKYSEKILYFLKNKNIKSDNEEQWYAQIGLSYANLNNEQEAEKYYEKSIEIYKKNKNYNNAIPLMMALVTTKIILTKYQEAENILKEAENFNSNYHGDDPGFKIQIYANYLYLYVKTNKINEFNEILVKFYSTTSDHSKGVFSEKYNVPTDNYISYIAPATGLIINRPKEWYQKNAIFFKSKTDKKIEDAIIELFEILRTSKINKSIKNMIDRSKDIYVAEEKKKLQNLIIKYEKIPKISDNPKENKETFKKIKLIRKEISEQKELILSKLNISRISNFSQEILVKDIQQELKNNQAIIYYNAFVGYLHISIITKENIFFKKIDEKNEKIKQLITQSRKTLKIVGAGEIPEFDFLSSKELYNLILNPVSDYLKNKDELIIIPHKWLFSLPFEVLINPEGKGSDEKDYKNINWFGKNHAISYYPSIYSFYNLNKIKFEQAKNDFLGFGDPKFKSEKKIKTAKIDYSNLMSRGIANADEIRKMRELPETKDELTFIANIFKGKSKLYLGEKFNEDVVKSINLKDYKFISFATHAVIANQINNIAEPGLILTPPKKSTKDNDGILTVSEIEKLDLQSDIVILSACNTAAEDGSPNAEGLSGLASAFFQAGTKSILVTHWDVETNSAVKLTTGMFDKMQKTKNLSQALHLSKMDILNNEETSHPIFWAPFVLIGNVTQSIN